MAATVVEIPFPAKPSPGQPGGTVVKIDADALMILSLVGWFIWDRLLRNRIATKLDGVFQPIEEERRLNNILAQIGLISKASRVVLCAFHNGALDNTGYHLGKISTVNTYTSPGHTPMAVPIRDLPIGRIMFELEQLIAAEKNEQWCVMEYDENLPPACRDHLANNSIYRMVNRLVAVGNLPIGILSLQYDSCEIVSPGFEEAAYRMLLDELHEEIASIMRRRIIHPGPIKRLWLKFTRRVLIP